MSAVTAVVLEVGPTVVRRLSPPSVWEPDPVLAAAALRGIDDPVVLLDDRAVSAAAVWDRLVALTCGATAQSLTLVVPVWWARHRVGRVVEAAARHARRVVTRTRPDLLVRNGKRTPVVVVEIGGDVLAVSGGDEVRILGPGCDTEAVVDAVVAVVDRPGEVLLDVASTDGDAADTARRIRAALSRRAIAARPVRLGDDGTAGEVERCRGRRALAAASATAVVCAAGIAISDSGSGDADHHSATTTLVEGRIQVRIPAAWAVDRVTAGPGSRRVQVSSPVDPAGALHITQSYTPGETLADTARVLEAALAGQPKGVFSDFRSPAGYAGREVVTYRESRIGREIVWTVLRDGSSRISIGCQSAPDREDVIGAPCEEAVRSAREVIGTERRH